MLIEITVYFGVGYLLASSAAIIALTVGVMRKVYVEKWGKFIVELINGVHLLVHMFAATFVLGNVLKGAKKSALGLDVAGVIGLVGFVVGLILLLWVLKELNKQLGNSEWGNVRHK